jgi:mono/diheme cytochrome c family protein
MRTRSFIGIAWAMAAILGIGSCTPVEDDPIVYLYRSAADPARGGQLYDTWWLVPAVLQPVPPGGIGTDAEGEELRSSLREDNPYYVANATNDLRGPDTWRCASCHGWDYLGADGADAQGPRATGFTGLMEARDKGILELYEILAQGRIGDAGPEEGHRYDEVLSRQDLVDLVAFLREGLIEPQTPGDAELGSVEFNGHCSSCHGIDGQELDFDDAVYDSRFVADVASTEVERFVHIVRFGRPGTTMPAGDVRAYLVADVADVLAYAQSLVDPLLAGASSWRGGVLYDTFWRITGGAEPVGDNPLYADPAWSQGSATGPDTWRCVECHGWDYRGVEGEYADGPHFTGIAGILAAAGKDPQVVFDTIFEGRFSDTLGNPTQSHQGHAFGDQGLLSASDAWDLVRFVRTGAVNLSARVDPDTGRSIGDAEEGANAFVLQCRSCHGARGTVVNGLANSPQRSDSQYLGDLARQEPWRIFHKIRFGHPGSESFLTEDGRPLGIMPNALEADLPLSQITNLVSACQQLPGSVERGGQLWDRWWTTPEVREPIAPGAFEVIDGRLLASSVPATNPHYDASRPPGNTRTGPQTWWCSECHGWDYAGDAGAYGAGSHYTGFPGVLGSPSLVDADALYSAMVDGPPSLPAGSHEFGQVLGEAALRDLVNFMMNGLWDTSEAVATDGTIAAYDPASADLRSRDANPAWGALRYESLCANCHGSDGQTLDLSASGEGADLGSLCHSDPWRVLHKMRVGHPGSSPPMPTASGVGYDTDTLTDILSHCQTLPR